MTPERLIKQLDDIISEAPLDFLGTGGSHRHAAKEEREWFDKFEEFKKELIAAVPVWRPIADAPKDGICGVIAAGNERMWIAHYDLEHGSWRAVQGYLINPTHFQPLPAPPKEQA